MQSCKQTLSDNILSFLTKSPKDLNDMLLSLKDESMTLTATDMQAYNILQGKIEMLHSVIGMIAPRDAWEVKTKITYNDRDLMDRHVCKYFSTSEAAELFKEKRVIHYKNKELYEVDDWEEQCTSFESHEMGKKIVITLTEITIK